MEMFDARRCVWKTSFFALLVAALFLVDRSHGFSVVRPAMVAHSWDLLRTSYGTSSLYLADSTNFPVIDMDADDDDGEDDLTDEEEEEDELEENSYAQAASSEFTTSNGSVGSSELAVMNDMPTNLDWGGALGKLRQRFDDMKQGKSGNPSQALFRLMSAQSPNQAIGSFVYSADPQVVQAMSGAVSSLLGGLSSPTSGVETIVKASGDKLGSLCFQLQMTGYVAHEIIRGTEITYLSYDIFFCFFHSYMFRNVEYVIALKDLMKLRGSATLGDYKAAFTRLDNDNSGYIESTEVAKLLNDVYDGKTPDFEIQTFIKFFDQDKDGKISWDEFERGLGAAMAAQQTPKATFRLPSQEDDEDDDEIEFSEPDISGTVEIELMNGKIVEVDAKEYIQNLKEEALALKNDLYREKGGKPPGSVMSDSLVRPNSAIDEFGGIASYIASQRGDVKALTQGISPEIVETMKMLVNFVLEGGESGKGKDIPKEKMEMEIPGAALRQLALWQLILGYRLREAEAKGDYLKLLE